MALTVEDGTIVANADSYITLADADAYHAARGMTLWATMSEAEREQALRRATDYMVQNFRLRWRGTRVDSEQSLDWPRNWVERADYSFLTMNGAQTLGGTFYYPSDEVPIEVQRACAELAYRGAAGPLTVDETRSQRTVREKVDVIEVEYSAWAPSQTTYRAIEALLSPFFGAGASGAMHKLNRV